MSATQPGRYSTEEFLRLIKSGDIQGVRNLLSADPALARATAPDGASAILLAIYHGHASMVRLFTAQGAELNFFEACAAGDIEGALQLLGRDPSLVNQRSPDGYTALGLAIFFGHDDVAEALLGHGADVNLAASNAQRVAPLHAAAARRNAKMVRRLLARGAHPDVVQAGGLTPLHVAAFRGEHEIARLLLERGADASVENAEGKTAAELAFERGHMELARWLKHYRTGSRHSAA